MDLAELDRLGLVDVAGGAQDDEDRAVVVLELRPLVGVAGVLDRERVEVEGALRRARAPRRWGRCRPSQTNSPSPAPRGDLRRGLDLAAARRAGARRRGSARSRRSRGCDSAPGARLLPLGDSVQTRSVTAPRWRRRRRARRAGRPPAPAPARPARPSRGRARQARDPQVEARRLVEVDRLLARARRRGRASRAGWRACRRRRSRPRRAPASATCARSASLRSTQSSIGASSVSAATSSPTSTPKRSTTSPTVSSESSTRRAAAPRRASSRRRPSAASSSQTRSGCARYGRAVVRGSARGARRRRSRAPSPSRSEPRTYAGGASGLSVGLTAAPIPERSPPAHAGGGRELRGCAGAGGGWVNETATGSRSAAFSISKNSRAVKPPRAGDDRVREDLDLRVVGLDVRVVDPARGLDLVLELGEVARELLEVLGRAQLRVLLGDDAQPAERLASAGPRPGSPRAGPSRLHRGGARLGHVLERLAARAAA